MRQKTALIPTLRSVAEAEMISHQLLLRAGFIRQVAAGVYTYLPLAQRVLNKISTIVREEMDRIGSQELLMPALNPAELWQESGRYDTYGPELVKLQDRHDRRFILGPTHEETITDLVRNAVNTYKKLPMTLYQIQTKFRDEKRPRSGLLRGREFIMKDAYSFHADRESLDEIYQDMYQAYVNIFTRCGLEFGSVEADSGSIGGKGTHEFMVFSEAGEDKIAICTSCDYSANIEMAEIVIDETSSANDETVAPIEKIHTPNIKTIDQLATFLQVGPNALVKTLLFIVDEQPVMVLVRGDHEVNEVKVKNIMEASTCFMADEQTIRNVTGASPGSLGPVNVKEKITILADQALRGFAQWHIGANQDDYHFLHAVEGRDFEVSKYADLRTIEEGDKCPRCGGIIRFQKGVEVGHIFKLGTKYSDAMKGTFLDANGREQMYIMGCYGIGISRTLSAVVEQHHDEGGIIWPEAISPYAVHLIAVNMKDETQRNLAEKLYKDLLHAGVEVLFDDRPERAGVKFKDADLIGIPKRIVVGSKATENLIELKSRRSGESQEVNADQILTLIQK
ncbi:proline--tRNA ligase [Shimazuella kribbensis]|uniref:proline--tRNA ligase n=1 Tax=Shimazuella kribbensis TaxID=139808 RepID=UPI000407E63E|nr:proline--tRNA ligase [Shimazuella kribbensis]